MQSAYCSTTCAAAQEKCPRLSRVGQRYHVNGRFLEYLSISIALLLLSKLMYARH
jgi:hypothetical protein